jgi:BMFP domain-containing protein YqiC
MAKKHRVVSEEVREGRRQRMKLMWARKRAEKSGPLSGVEFGDGVAAAPPPMVRKISEKRVRAVNQELRAKSQEPTADVESRFQGVYDKALKMLEGMIEEPLDLEQLNAVIKTCRENLAAIGQAKVREVGSKMEVVTVLDFGEKAK